MPAIRIEPMVAEDVDAALAIERASFTNPWSRGAFLRELRDNRVARLWVARPGSGPGLLGYLCLWVVLDELHVTNLAVAPGHRRQGIGRQLLGTLLEYYRGQGASRAMLEVRPGNAEARRLYAAFGFRQVGLRRGYYFDTGEDALLLEASLGDTPPPPRNPSASLGVS
jgi:ribosomal-protein-alanine N-acetyltransferase